MKDAGDPPPAPDPRVSADAQMRANIQAAIANARLNRVNQQTPWGSITYTQGEPDENGVPSYSSQISLSPQQQALLEMQQRQQMLRGQMGNDILEQNRGVITAPLDFSGLHSVYDKYADNRQWNGNPQRAAAPAPAASAAPMGGGMQAPMPAPGAVPQGGPNENPIARQIAQLLRASPAANGQVDSLSKPAMSGGDPSPMMEGEGITYQDYLNYFKERNGHNSEGGGGQPLDEATFNALDQREKFNNAGGGLILTPQDARYAALAEQLGGEAGRNIHLTGPDGRDMTQFLVDPSRQVRGNGWSAHKEDNQTPDFQSQDDEQWNYGAILGAAALPIMAGAATGAFAGAGAGAGGAGAAGTAADTAGALGTGAFDMAGSTGFGGTVPIGGVEGGLGATGAAAQPSSSVWSQMLDNFTNGRGLLGLSSGQNTALRAVPALATALRRPSGGKK